MVYGITIKKKGRRGLMTFKKEALIFKTKQQAKRFVKRKSTKNQMRKYGASRPAYVRTWK